MEIFDKHCPLGTPIRIPIYRSGIKVDLLFYLFLRVSICDAPARDHMGMFSGESAFYGCGGCLAKAQRIKSY